MTTLAVGLGIVIRHRALLARQSIACQPGRAHGVGGLDRSKPFLGPITGSNHDLVDDPVFIRAEIFAFFILEHIDEVIRSRGQSGYHIH